MRFALFLTLPCLAMATNAAAFTAQNGMTVTPSGGGQFTVEYDRVPHATDYLCAAGDFVIRGLGLPNRTRIYRASPAPRKAGQGIGFTLDRSASVPLGIVSSFGSGKEDGGISAGASTGSYCSDFWWMDR